MALNIKNPEVERLAREVSMLTGESKTAAVLEALRERKARLQARSDRRAGVDEFAEFLAAEVWSIPSRKTDVTDDDVLGFGPSGA